jgi:hypothetical protein
MAAMRLQRKNKIFGKIESDWKIIKYQPSNREKDGDVQGTGILTSSAQ